MALGKGLNSLIPQQKKVRHIIRKETGLTDSTVDKVWEIPLAEIIPNSEQPRRDFSHSELEGLVLSIQKHGILQPLIVSEREDGGYELIAGERRLRAAEIANLTAVPALVRTATQQEKLELALVENIQRQNLNPIEEAFAYSRLIEEFNLTQEEVATQVGKSRPTIANMVRLLDLPELAQKALIDGQISVGKARALLGLKTEKEQLQLLQSLLGQKMTVREVEGRVAKQATASHKGSVRRDPNIRAQEELLEENLGTKVRITQRGERGKIIIEYNSKEELRRLLQDLAQF